MASVLSYSKAQLDILLSGITKATLGLGNVDNTSDANKPVSTATANAIAALDQGITTRAMTMPTGLGWDTTVLNPTISLIGKWSTGAVAGLCSISPVAAFGQYSAAYSAPAQTYYVSTTGSDAAAGGSSTPLATIGKAVQKANTAGTPTMIRVNAGVYPYPANPNGVNTPQVDIAFVAVGGRVDTGTFENFSAPTLDATYTSTYSYAPGTTTTTAVIDRLRTTADGHPVEFNQVTSAAICNVTGDSWYTDGTTLYINRRDQAAVTSTNTRVLHSGNVFYVTANVNVYIGGADAASGFDVMGGSVACYNASRATAETNLRAFVIENCTGRFPGVYSNAARVFVSESRAGLTFYQNCHAGAAPTDGFNFHNTSGSTKMQVLTVNCSAYDLGRPGNNSCNGWTSHDNVVGIDVAGRYRHGHGGTHASVNSSKSWILAPWNEDDYGDIVLAGGGTYPPTGFYVRDTATYWIEEGRVDLPSSARAYAALTSGCTIHKKNCQPVRQYDYAATGATIDSLWP